MGRYLDIAAGVITELDTDSQCEKSELSEISPRRAPDREREKSELSEISLGGKTRGTTAASTKIVLLHVPPGVPEAWVQGVADLLAMARPASCPEAKWQVLREDAYHFLRGHAARAHGLGWTALDLFGVHRERPWARLDVMGLVPLLDGARVTALSATEAVIEKPSGARLTFRRRGQVADEACLIWELET